MNLPNPSLPRTLFRSLSRIDQHSESCRSVITQAVKDPQTIPTSSTLYEKVKLSIKEVPIKSVLALRMFQLVPT